MAKPRLVISAAHTNLTPGAIYKDLREFDLTKKILNLVTKHLQEEKIEHKAVPIDLHLLDRISWINKTSYSEEKGDIFIEIHINDGGKRGIEAWYGGKDSKDNNAKILADLILQELVRLTKYKSQGVHSEFDHELKSLAILNQTNPISAAFELLYIDNEEDYKILKDEPKLDELAKNFVASIKKYINNPPKLNKVTKKDMANIFSNFKLPDFNNPFDKTPTKLGSSNSPKNNIMMDREERKKMIQRVYKKIFGKDVQQRELNSYLNMGVNEESLIKKLTDSKEFEELVKNANDYSKTKQKIEQTENELKTLRAKVNDMNGMQMNLNKLLAHKNLQIKQMMQELTKRGIIKNGEYFDPNRIR